MIKNIKELNMNHKHEYGGKACTLGTLKREGFRVPEGIALSTEFYENYLKSNRVIDSSNEIKYRNREIRENLINGDIKKQSEELLLREFQKTFKKEKKKYVVRSSAICEDGKERSFAGIFESFVGVESIEQMKDSIKSCYASMFKDRVIEYFLREGLDFSNLKMGVIIQEYIEGEYSGVVFSVDTVKLRKDFMNIEVVRGRCCEFVQGEKQAENLIIDKIGRGRNNKSKFLSEEKLKKLIDVSKSVEKYMINPQDIEWTFCDEELFLLQSRDITTFKEHMPLDGSIDTEGRSWYRENSHPYKPLICEMNMEIGEALNESFLRVGFQEFYSDYCLYNGYLYYREREMIDKEQRRVGYRNYLADLQREHKDIFHHIILPQMIFKKKKLDELLASGIDENSIVEFFERAWDYTLFQNKNHMLAAQGDVYLEEFHRYCKGKVDISVEEFQSLVYKRSILLDERLFIEKLSKCVLQNEELLKLFNQCSYDRVLYERLLESPARTEFMIILEEYLNMFGKCNEDMQVNSPYIEPIMFQEPYRILKWIRNGLKRKSSVIEGVNEIEKNKKSSIEKILEHLSQDEIDDFKRKLAFGEEVFLIREDHHFYFERMSKTYMNLALESMASIMLRNKIIEDKTDIEFLYIHEIKELFNRRHDFSQVIENRKERYSYQSKLIPSEIVGEHENIKIEERPCNEVSCGEFKGQAGLRMNVQGEVKKGIPDVLVKESIIVLPYSRIGGLDHLIHMVKGIIVESGSPFDHVGIQARELGIPVIYNISGIFDFLNDGDFVEIDGFKESVKKLNK